jgi:hypothetical protein
VLKNYFPDSAATLDPAHANSLAAIPDGQAKNDGITVGEAAAAAMIANRANDGSAPPQFHTPPSADPGEWQTTPAPGCPFDAGGEPLGGVLLHWSDVTPFGVQSSDQFRSPPPPPLDSGKYARDYAEVKRVGAIDSNKRERPRDRANVARYFAVATPPHVFGQAASQASVAQGWSLSQNARAFALLTMAINDALISSMETKYHYVYWRPITAIRAGDTDGNAMTNPDPDWEPFITTPCFPSYNSAHASGSNAARRVAEKLFGMRGHDITLSHPSIPDFELQYTRFSQITDDVDDARVFGGIHYRFDQEAGARQGRQVASYIFRNQLRPVGENDDN